jgi:hypothetical protein
MSSISLAPHLQDDQAGAIAKHQLVTVGSSGRQHNPSVAPVGEREREARQVSCLEGCQLEHSTPTDRRRRRA